MAADSFVVETVHAVVVDCGAMAQEVGVVKPHLMSTKLHGAVAPNTGRVKPDARVVVPVSLSRQCSVALLVAVSNAVWVVGTPSVALDGALPSLSTTKFDSDPVKYATGLPFAAGDQPRCQYPL